MSYSAKVRTSSSTSALSASAVQKLKEDLSVSKPKVEAEVNVPCGRYCYVTSHRQGQGSAWTEFPSKELAAQMLHSVPDAFDANAFTKVRRVTILEYKDTTILYQTFLRFC